MLESGTRTILIWIRACDLCLNESPVTANKDVIYSGQMLRQVSDISKSNKPLALR